ncbi:hypothetical protein GFS31_10020 [Leptolyngbya sp. BL0902]|nr:hypothetical protein GFS31_10020 [Leptolyngbya sp. BL0902]
MAAGRGQIWSGSGRDPASVMGLSQFSIALSSAKGILEIETQDIENFQSFGII